MATSSSCSAIRRTAPVAVAFVLLELTGCGVRELPPPTAPDKIVPELDEPPPAPEGGRGVVVIDATNGPAKVYEVLGTTAADVSLAGRYGHASSVTTRLVCNSTPCFTTGPLGAYTLVLESADPEKIERNVRDTVTLDLRRRPTVVRHTFGEGTRTSALSQAGPTAVALGAGGLLLGGMFWFLGATRDPPDGFVSVGETTLIVSAVVLAAGIVVSIVGRPTHQSGATTQWTLPKDRGSGPSPTTTYPGANTF
jgi:hypothetical protein